MRAGVITEFDVARGLGSVRGDDGSSVPFQCLAIADGSRSIDVGAAVRYDLLPKLGAYEAWNICPTS